MRQLIFLCALCSFLFTSCDQMRVNKEKYTRHIDQLNQLLSDKYLKNYEIGKHYEVTKLISTNDPLYVQLIENGIINEKSYISYSNKDCITLVTRIQENELIHSFTDVLITRNVRLGQFICGINDIYLLNQDEYIVRISTYSESLSLELTITTVNN